MADKHAFLVLYEPIHSRFVRYCRSLAYGKMDPRDLAQDAVMVALPRGGEFRDPGHLLAFLVGVAHKIFLRQLKKAKRFDVLDPEKEAYRHLVAQTGDPALALEIHELHRAMDQLSHADRDCLILFEITGYAIAEIAALRSESEGAVKTRLSRARQRLRSVMEDAPKSRQTEPVARFFSILSLL